MAFLPSLHEETAVDIQQRFIHVHHTQCATALIDKQKLPSPPPLAPVAGACTNRTHLTLMGCAPPLHNIPRTNLQTPSAWRVIALMYCRAAVVDSCVQDQRKTYPSKPALLRKLESACCGTKLTTSHSGLGHGPAVSLQTELQAKLSLVSRTRTNQHSKAEHHLLCLFLHPLFQAML